MRLCGEVSVVKRGCHRVDLWRHGRNTGILRLRLRMTIDEGDNDLMKAKAMGEIFLF